MTIAERAFEESKSLKEAAEQHVRKTLLESSMPNIKRMIEESLLAEFDDEQEDLFEASKKSKKLNKEAEDKESDDSEDSEDKETVEESEDSEDEETVEESDMSDDELLESVLREMGYTDDNLIDGLEDTGYMYEMGGMDDDEMYEMDDMDDPLFEYEDEESDDFYDDETMYERRGMRRESRERRPRRRVQESRESRELKKLRLENKRLKTELSDRSLNLSKLVKLHNLVVKEGLKPLSQRYNAVVDLLDEATTLKESQMIIDHTKKTLTERKAENKVKTQLSESSTRQVRTTKTDKSSKENDPGYQRLRQLMG